MAGWLATAVVGDVIRRFSIWSRVHAATENAEQLNKMNIVDVTKLLSDFHAASLMAAVASDVAPEHVRSEAQKALMGAFDLRMAEFKVKADTSFFPTLLEKYLPTVTASSDWDFAAAPWVTDESKDTKLDADLGKLDAAIADCGVSARVAEAVLGNMKWSPNNETTVAALYEGFNQVKSQQAKCAKVMACCLLSRLLTRPRVKSFQADLKQILSYVTGKLKTRVTSLPDTLQKKLADAQAADPTASGDTLSTTATSAGKSAGSGASTVGSTENPAKRRKVLRRK